MPHCTASITITIFLLAIGFADAHNLVSQFPPDMNVRINHVLNTDWVCNTTVPRRNGFIYSHEQALLRNVQGSNLNYPDDIDCRLLIMVGQGWHILVQFPVGIRLACGTKHDSCDCVKLFDGKTEKDSVLKTLCGHYDPDEVSPVETNSSSMLVVFKTDGNCQSSRGFIIQYSAFRRVLDSNATESVSSPTYRDHECSVEEYRCDKHKCIPRSFLCDHIAQCLDKTDEGFTGCTAEDQMRYLLGSIGAKHVLAFLGMFLVLLMIILISCCYYGDPLRGYRLLRNEFMDGSTKVQPFRSDSCKGDMDNVHPVLLPGVEFPGAKKQFYAKPFRVDKDSGGGGGGGGTRSKRQVTQRFHAGTKDGFGSRHQSEVKEQSKYDDEESMYADQNYLKKSRQQTRDTPTQEFARKSVRYPTDDGERQSSQSSDFSDQLYTLMTDGSHSMLVPVESSGQNAKGAHKGRQDDKWNGGTGEEMNAGVHLDGDDRKRKGRRSSGNAKIKVNEEDYIFVPNAVPPDPPHQTERLNRKRRPSRRSTKTEKCGDDQKIAGMKRHTMEEKCRGKHNMTEQEKDEFFMMHPERIAGTAKHSGGEHRAGDYYKGTPYEGASKQFKSSKHAAHGGGQGTRNMKCNESNNAKSTDKPYLVMAASNYNALMHPSDEMYVGTKHAIARSEELIADDDSYVSTKSAIARRQALVTDDDSSTASTPTSVCSTCSRRQDGVASVAPYETDSELMCPACFHNLPEVTCPQKL